MIIRIPSLLADLCGGSFCLLIIGLCVVSILMGCSNSNDANQNSSKMEKSSGGRHGRIETNMGNIEIEFFEKDSPKAVENFRLLSERGYYDGLTFHRVVKGFMIQGGDPKGNGTGGQSAWGGQFDDEIDRGSDLYRRGYRRGIIAMANSGPNTNGSQFFIMHQDSNLPPNYVIFANVTEGQTVVDSLAEVPTDFSSNGEMSQPTQPLVIKKVVITP